MNGETIVLLENFCRTCMNGDTEFKKSKGVSIFNKTVTVEFRNLTVTELLMLTTPQLNIDSGDMLPKIVCESCLESLISAYKFQKMCIRVEKKLREMIKVEDPLKDSLMDISIQNVAVSHAITDLPNIIKTEIDEPLVDENESGSYSKTLADDLDVIKFEIDDMHWQENIHSDEHNDSDSEWETMSQKLKRKKRTKAAAKKVRKEIELSSNRKEDESSTVMKNESKLNSNLTDDIKHAESKKFACEECGKGLKSRKTLIQHKRTHLRTNDPEFVCDECGNSLSSLTNLKRHKTIHLRPVDDGINQSLVKTKHECKICKKVFRESASLKHHLRTHTGEHPYICSECGKVFKSLSNLNQHFLRHSTERPHACPDCPKRFPCLSDLACHKEMHNKTKPHVCDICGAAFAIASLLKKHNMYHNGVRNHKCDYCDMRFVLADKCRRHMRTHTGEKPYKCKYCERAYAQSNDLIKHLRGHLGDNVYKCNLCPQRFRLKMDLRAHFNTHKNDDEETKVRNLEALKKEEHRLQLKLGLEN